MKKRDLAILNDLQRFRCLTRDDIIDLHFKSLKQPVTCCNTVLKRLRRDGYIEVSTKQLPYTYFAAPSPIKKDSTKIPHFLKIAEFYRSLIKYEEPKSFIVEPKFGKGYMEPDAFMLWKRGPFFVEIQRSIYSDKVMKEKVGRYDQYYLSNEWQQEPWQPENKKVFPTVLMLTDTRYSIESPYVRFIQVQNIEQLVNTFIPKVEKSKIEVKSNSLKLKTS
ncbi:replication-relaxation family protein [Neobacillus jeddahensis]|uniref:replication-relaxation family protein n=1 Tax=Neobacillus jeddahensis TaxID=1461580 RepID=UPI0005A81ECA|nr:replication-relaxation family protein [Neobacillus jeddahensis]